MMKRQGIIFFRTFIAASASNEMKAMGYAERMELLGKSQKARKGYFQPCYSCRRLLGIHIGKVYYQRRRTAKNIRQYFHAGK